MGKEPPNKQMLLPNEHIPKRFVVVCVAEIRKRPAGGVAGSGVARR
jgi:hypothetical protein